MEHDSRRLHFLVSLARAYYEQGLRQDQIAQNMGISRSQISRYLREARETGIVQIRVIDPGERVDALASQLLQRFASLRSAVVIPVFSYDERVVRQMVGAACASYLKQGIHAGECLCIGCGRTIRSAIEALGSYPMAGLSVVQAMGSVGHEAMDIDFNELTRAAAAAFHARAYYLNAPAILGSGTAAALEAANVGIHESLDRARKADVFLVGIGSLESDQLYARAGLITLEDIHWLQERAIAGDICGRFFDAHGKECVTPFGRRVVGITLQDLRQARLSIGVAGGSDKAVPIHAALGGGWINALVTDDQTARTVLKIDQELRGGEPAST